MSEAEIELIKEIRQVVQILGVTWLVREIDHVFGEKVKSDRTTRYVYKSAAEMMTREKQDEAR